MQSPPNVLLIVLDSARARNTSLHGHINDTTPTLRGLAEEATVYEQARAPSIHSIASHASIWSGYHVEQHGCSDHSSRLTPSETVWADLNDEGYHTGLFTPNSVVGAASNLAEPFDYCDVKDVTIDRPFPEALTPLDLSSDPAPVDYLRACIQSNHPIRGLINGADAFRRSRTPQPSAPAEQFAKSFLDWQATQNGPWGACLNFLDPHLPYLPDERYDRWADERLRSLYKSIPPGELTDQLRCGDRKWWQLSAFEALYDGGICQADGAVGQIVRALKNRGVYDDTLLVVTSDHGDGFGERSVLRPRLRFVKHLWGIGEVLTHVPLVVKYPSQETADRVSEPATLTRFRPVVEAAVAGQRETFADDPVLTSTVLYRERDAEGREDEPMIADAVGPWRAVYEQDGNVVRKSVAVGSDYEATATVEIVDAQMARQTVGDDGGRVEQVFESISTPQNLSQGSTSIDADTEARLAELGYIVD